MAGEPSGPVDDFATTRWSVVARAKDPGTPEARAALTELCRVYWYPLYAYVRRHAGSAERAEDLTQAFFVHLLEKNVLASADAGRGRFRAFLLACCKNFLANEREREQARKRGGGVAALSLDFASAEARYRLEPADPATPEKLFERRWALTLLEGALARLERECADGGKAELYARLRPVLVCAAEAPALADVAGELGMGVEAVKKAAQRLRRRCGALLREEIAATVDGPHQVEDEVRALFAILSS